MKKKSLYYSCLLLIIILFTGCNNKTMLGNTDKRKNIEFIAKMRGGDYWNTVRMGADAAANELNVNLNFIATEKEDDVGGQIKLVNEAIEKKVDGIVLAANDYDVLASVVEKAHLNKIPIIVVDSDVNSKNTTSYIGTNNFEAGKNAAEMLIDAIGSNVNIAIVSYVKNAKNAIDRENGVMSVISQKAGINVIAKVYCFSNEEIASEQTKKILMENDRVEGIIALNSSSTIGVARAVEELGISERVKVIGFDSSNEEIQYMDKGIIYASIVQQPLKMGYLGVQYAAMASRGKKVAKIYDTGFKTIDKSNVYLPENQKFIFPFVK